MAAASTQFAGIHLMTTADVPDTAIPECLMTVAVDMICVVGVEDTMIGGV